MSSHLTNLLDVVGETWVPPVTQAKSICSFDLFFLSQLAAHQDAFNITELGCGATTMELCRLGYDVTTFSLDISEAVKKTAIDINFVKCNVMDRKFLDRIINSVKNSELLVIDCLHTAKMAEYYSKNILPHAQGFVWIHDYWNSTGYIPYGEQRYLDTHVIGVTHRIWTLTDLPMKDVKVVSSIIGHDITPQRHKRPLSKNYGPRMCSVVLEKIK